ncbi:hypothetical protein YC2023_109819 [Brassica napus]
MNVTLKAIALHSSRVADLENWFIQSVKHRAIHGETLKPAEHIPISGTQTPTDKPRPKTDQENKLIQGIREGPLATGSSALKPASSRQRYQPTAHPTPLRRCVTVTESQAN